MNGSLAEHPKEEAYVKTIASNYDQAQALQEEKVALSEKAAVIVRVSLYYCGDAFRIPS